MLLSFNFINTFSQTGGNNVYEFLNMSPGAYMTAAGGFNISTRSNDPSLAMFNPSLSGPDSDGHLSLSYVNYFAGINYGSVMYSHFSDSSGSFSAGINYLNYGRFDRTDESGNINGNFSAAEYAFNLVYARQLDSFLHAGVNIKPIISQLEAYISLGIAMDIGISCISPDGYTTAGLAIRNMGLQLTTYSGRREKLPFEIMAGISTRLRHAPLRFSLTARHLEKYDLIHEYTDQEEKEEYSQAGKIAENIMRHLIFGAELSPSENFFISAGFNYQRRKELAYKNKTSTVGFSLGAGIKTSSVNLMISRARYHLAGSSTTFSILIKPALFKNSR